MRRDAVLHGAMRGGDIPNRRYSRYCKLQTGSGSQNKDDEWGRKAVAFRSHYHGSRTMVLSQICLTMPAPTGHELRKLHVCARWHSRQSDSPSMGAIPGSTLGRDQLLTSFL